MHSESNATLKKSEYKYDINIYYRLNSDISCDNYLININIINNEVFDFHPYLHLENRKHVMVIIQLLAI